MLCYSYEHRAATNLHKNVGRKLWGCAAHSHGTRECTDERLVARLPPIHMLPTKYETNNGLQQLPIPLWQLSARNTSLPSLLYCPSSQRAARTLDRRSVCQSRVAQSVSRHRQSKCQCLIWLLSLLCGLPTKNIVIVKGNIILSK